MRIVEPMPAMQNIDEGVKIERVTGRTDSGKHATAPGLPHVKMIDPGGHVVSLVIRSTRNLKEAAKAGVDTIGYEAFIMRKKRRKGWLVYDEVPEAQRETIIAERKAYHQAQSAPYRQAWDRQDLEAALQSKAAMNEALQEFMSDAKRLAAAEKAAAERKAAVPKNGQ